MGGAGEVAGEVLRGAMRMKYGRRAEDRADRFAVELMAASGINPLYYADALQSFCQGDRRLRLKENREQGFTLQTGFSKRE